MELLSYVMGAPETRIVLWLGGFILGVLCAGLLSRVMTS